MWIASLLASATEIIAALGLKGSLVGVSHCCDYPAGVEGLPVLTSSVVDKAAPQAEIDRIVRDHLADNAALYALDTDLLERLQPDLIVTQALCDVCAVSGADVEAALGAIASKPRLVNLEPVTLADVLKTIHAVAVAAGVPERGEQLVMRLNARIDRVVARVARHETSPRVLLLDWLDPPFMGGHWIADLITLAGGVDVSGLSGAPSRRTDWDEVAALQPDYLILAMCGFEPARTRADAALGEAGAALAALERAGTRVRIVDGNGLFNRPGPRLVDSLELLASLIHPLSDESPSSRRLSLR